MDYLGEEYMFKPGSTLRSIMKKLKINPEIHIVLVNGKLETEDYRAKTGDRIKILRIISGG